MKLHGDGRVLAAGLPGEFEHALALDVAGLKKGFRRAIQGGKTGGECVDAWELVGWSGCVVHLVVQHGLERSVASDRGFLKFPEVIAQVVFGDATEPRDERAGDVEVGKFAPCGDERFLGEILGLVLAAETAEKKCPDERLVPEDEFRKRVVVALAGERDPVRIIGRSGHGAGYQISRLGRAARCWIERLAVGGLSAAGKFDTGR